MNNYYFTFGQNHYTNEGIRMFNRWVRVVASDWNKARGEFIRQFTNTNMSAPDMWSFQYEEKDFNPGYYPMGEFLVIHENQKEVQL